MLTTMASAVPRLILVLALGLPAQAPVEVPAPAPPSMTVVIDPGHGGDDCGAVGPSGLEEKLVALAVAQRVRALAGERGVRVMLTREDDRQVSLMQRAAFANGAGAAVFITLHANAAPRPSARVRRWPPSPASRRFRRQPLPRIERYSCP